MNNKASIAMIALLAATLTASPRPVAPTVETIDVIDVVEVIEAPVRNPNEDSRVRAAVFMREAAGEAATSIVAETRADLDIQLLGRRSVSFAGLK